MTDFDSQYQTQPSGDMDLLRQISAEDEIQEETQKKKSSHSIVMICVILFMKLTFVLDDAKRKNQRLFCWLKTIWATFMSLIYMGGVVMLALLLYSYVTFPDKVRQALQSYDINCKEYHITEMSLSKVELENLEDVNDTYLIKRMIVESTFADFIRGRVKSVVLEGVTIRITETKEGLELGALPKILIRLNKPMYRSLRVDNLAINRAVLEMNGVGYSLPVSFSLRGIYANVSKVSIPLFIQEKYANIDATLSIAGSHNKTEFTLKINAGTLTLPKRTPENISGEIVATAQNMKLDSVKGKLSFVYGKNEKVFDLSMSTEKDQNFSGSLRVQASDATSQTSDVYKTDVAVHFSDMIFDTPLRFKTNKQLSFLVYAFEKNGMRINNMNIALDGQLSCDSFKCSYDIQKPSSVSVDQSEMNLHNNKVVSNDPYGFVLLPTDKTELFFDGQTIQYDVLLKDFVFNGYKDVRDDILNVEAKQAKLSGLYDTIHQTKRMSLDAENINFSLPDVSFEEAYFKQDNIFNNASRLQLRANHVNIQGTDIVKTPFKMSLDKTGANTRATASFEEGKIQVSFLGISSFHTGTFQGNIYIREFDLGSLKTPLDQISSLFPTGLQKISGKMAVLGEVEWRSSKQISGPLHVSFKNIGFEKDNITVSGLNTVLSFLSLQPMITPANQTVFVEKIAGHIPLQNVEADIKIDSQFVKVSSVKTDVAGIELNSDPALISLRAPRFLLNMKNNSIDLDKMVPYLNLSGLKMKGRAGLSFGLDVKNGNLYVSDGQMDVAGTTLDLRLLKDGKIKNYFGSAQDYTIQNGFVLIDTNDTDEKTNFNISLDGRIMPGNQIKNVREVVDESLSGLIKPMPTDAVPDVIIKKQQIITQ